MTTQHTPGLWTASAPAAPDSHDAGSFNIWAGGEKIICSRSAWPFNAQESNANARLIASAPALLEALQELDDLINEPSGYEDYTAELVKASNKARAVLAAAKAED